MQEWAEIAMLSTQPSRKSKFEHVVTDSERETVHGLLMDYQQSLINNEDEAHLYTGTSITSGFPTQLIDGITKELHTIGNHIDLEELVLFFNINEDQLGEPQYGNDCQHFSYLLQTDFEKWDKVELASVLKKFYVEVRREDGTS